MTTCSIYVYLYYEQVQVLSYIIQLVLLLFRDLILLIHISKLYQQTALGGEYIAQVFSRFGLRINLVVVYKFYLFINSVDDCTTVSPGGVVRRSHTHVSAQAATRGSWGDKYCMNNTTRQFDSSNINRGGKTETPNFYMHCSLAGFTAYFCDVYWYP